MHVMELFVSSTRAARAVWLDCIESVSVRAPEQFLLLLAQAVDVGRTEAHLR